MAASAEELNNQAEVLKEAVSFFKIDFNFDESHKFNRKGEEKTIKNFENRKSTVLKSIDKGININLDQKDHLDGDFIGF